MNLNLGRWLKSVFNSSLRTHGYQMRKMTDLKVFDDLLYRRLRNNPGFCFVQIGANDGVSFDPIYDFVTQNNVSGLVVEPLADCFSRLEQNYRNHPRVRARNIAIHRSQNQIDLYRVNPDYHGTLPDWAVGIASVDPAHFKLGGDIPDEAIIVERVEAVTLQALLEEAGYTELDLLQIDTEGYDYEILQMLMQSSIRPAIIHFEHGLQQGIMDEQQFAECFRLLRAADYFILMEKFDVIAVKPELLPG